MALIVLLFMFGTLGGVVVPFLFAFVTLPTTLGIVVDLRPLRWTWRST